MLYSPKPVAGLNPVNYTWIALELQHRAELDARISGVLECGKDWRAGIRSRACGVHPGSWFCGGQQPYQGRRLRRSPFHPVLTFIPSRTRVWCGASGRVPAAEAEHPLSAQLRDIRRNARQWARSAESSPSSQSVGHSGVGASLSGIDGRCRGSTGQPARGTQGLVACADVGSQAENAGHRCSGQQDGPRHLGPAGQRRHLQNSGRGGVD